MISLYRYFTKLVKTSLRSASFIPELMDHFGLCTSAIGRRVLHQEIHDPVVRKALDNTVIHPIQKQKMLQRIQALAAVVPTGSVGVKQDLATLTLCDWLDIERSLIKGTLLHSKSVSIPAQILLKQFNRPVDTPLFIYQYAQKTLFNQGTNVLGIIALCAMIGFGPMLSDGKSEILKCAAFLVTTLFPLGVYVTGIDKLLDRALTGKGRQRSIETVSASWDEVFQSRNLEDAILLGMLNDFYSNVTTEDWDRLRVPNFLAMAPVKVYELFSRLLDDSGETPSHRYRELLDFTAAYAARAAQLDSEGDCVTSTIEGCDLSALLPSKPLVVAPSP